MLLSYFSSSEAFGRKGVAVLDNKKRAPDSVISHALPKAAENVELVFVCGGKDGQFRHLLVASAHYRGNVALLSGSGIDSAPPEGRTILHRAESALLVRHDVQRKM